MHKSWQGWLSWKYLENRTKPIDAFTAKFSSIFQSTFVLTHITSHTLCEIHIARLNNRIIHTYIQTIATKWISWGSSQLWRNSNSCNASLIISYTFPKRLSAPLGDHGLKFPWWTSLIEIISFSLLKMHFFWGPFAFGSLWLWCNCFVLFLCPDSCIDSKDITVPSPIVRFLIMDHGLSSNSEKLPNFHFA